jgi:GAF domain-containing protein
MPGEHSRAERVAAAEADLAARKTIPEILRALCRHLVDVLDVSASIVSRIVGEMLVELAAYSKADVNLKQLGHGYLIADYPLTHEVLEHGTPEAVSLDDPDVDPAEARLLRELGFERLLMLSLPVEGRPWALVELYCFGGTDFNDEHARMATSLAVAAGAAIEHAGAA